MTPEAWENFMIFFLVLIMLRLASACQVSEFKLEDPSIWSFRTIVDDLLDKVTSVIDPKSVPVKFTADDYELKELLVTCIKLGDWMLFQSMLFIDVENWTRIPEIEEIIGELVGGSSEIIYEMFLRDKRIRQDDRIIRKAREFFNYEKNGLSRIATAFDSGTFTNYEGYEIAEEIFRIPEPVPIEWYYQSIPRDNLKNSSDLMKIVAMNTTIPRSIIDHLVNDTLVPLDPIPIPSTSLKISLHSLSDVYGNWQLRYVLLNSPRYTAWIVKTNTKIDLMAKRVVEEMLMSGIEL